MIVVGADFGSNDMTAIVISRRDEDGHLHVLHAWEGSGEPPSFFQVSLGDGQLHIVSAEAVQLEWWLRKRHVSLRIVERVLRLSNPKTLSTGRPLRGIHYKEPGRYLAHVGATSKGEIIRRFGREVFNRIPRSLWIKRGKRIFVSERDVQAARRGVS